MGQRPTEDELFSLISEVDSDFSGTIDFSEFLRIIEKQKEKATAHNDEQDFVDAFVACGGNEDRTGIGEVHPRGIGVPRGAHRSPGKQCPGGAHGSPRRPQPPLPKPGRLPVP